MAIQSPMGAWDYAGLDIDQKTTSPQVLVNGLIVSTITQMIFYRQNQIPK